jgi:hypothetical protein
MLQISLSSMDEDKYYEWKKVKKAYKKVKSIAAWMLNKSSMSAKVVKSFRKDLLAVCDQVKQQVSSSKASPCDMEMPFLDNGNMKQFHKAFMNYFPSLLLLKKSTATYKSLGLIQRRNGQDFSNG